VTYLIFFKIGIFNEGEICIMIITELYVSVVYVSLSCVKCRQDAED